MYAVAKEKKQRERLRILREIGTDLAEALKLSEAGPDTLGERAAWAKAERAAKRMADVVELTDGAQPIVRAAMGRVSR